MNETMTVRLPSGTVINNVPVGTSKEEIKDKAIRAGLANESDFITDAVAQQAANLPEKSVPWYTEAADFIKENMEIPGGVAGAVAGGVAGAPLGPPGIVIGSILGGAAGSAGGSLLSDELSGEELDYAQAVREAGISLGFDAVTLGLGKIARPGYFAFKKAMGFTPKETAEELLQAAKLGQDVGSRESLMASQNILSESGGTLTPYQTGQSTARQRIQEQFARTGLLSSKVMKDNAEKVNQIVADNINEIMQRSGTSMYSPDVLGRSFYDIIDEGKSAMSTVYGQGLSEIQQDIGGKLVPTKLVKNSLDSFVAQYQREFGSILDDDTLRYVNGLQDSLSDLKTMNASSLIDLEKKISKDIRQFGDINSGVYNSAAERELADFSSSLKESMAQTLRLVSPESATKYANIKKEYATAIQGLLPEINANVVKKATKENFEALGNMLLTNGSIDQVKKFMRSIDVAYGQLGKAGRESAVLRSSGDAKQVLKEAYLKKLFPNTSEGFDIAQTKYKKLAKKFSVPREAERLKVILGEDYGRTKQLMNLMKEASEKPTSNIGELVLRSKEYAALGALAGGVAASSPLLAASAATVLLGPVFLAKIATNPKSVNKMLAFSKKQFKSEVALSVAASNLVLDLMTEFNDADKAEIRNSIRESQQGEQ